MSEVVGIGKEQLRGRQCIFADDADSLVFLTHPQPSAFVLKDIQHIVRGQKGIQSVVSVVLSHLSGSWVISMDAIAIGGNKEISHGTIYKAETSVGILSRQFRAIDCRQMIAPLRCEIPDIRPVMVKHHFIALVIGYDLCLVDMDMRMLGKLPVPYGIAHGRSVGGNNERILLTGYISHGMGEGRGRERLLYARGCQPVDVTTAGDEVKVFSCLLGTNEVMVLQKKSALTLLDAHQSLVCAYPRHATFVVDDEADFVRRQQLVLYSIDLTADGTVIHTLQMTAAFLVVIKPKMPAIDDDMTAKGLIGRQYATPVDKSVVLYIETAVQVSTQPYPHITVAPIGNVLYRLVGKQLRIAGCIHLLIVVAVIAIESAAGAYPDESRLVLRHTAGIIHTDGIICQRAIRSQLGNDLHGTGKKHDCQQSFHVR